MASGYSSSSSQSSQIPSVELSTQPGQRFSAAGPLITIGRGPDNDIVVNDPEVSRRHVSLTWDGRRYIIQDLGTANGTFVNGARLTATQAVQSGDVIGLGATVALTFQTVAPAATADTAIRAAAKRGSTGRGAGKGWAALPLLAVALAACGLLAIAAAAGYYFLRPKAAGLPLVLIDSPRHGEQVEVGQELTIHAVARDAGKVARVELWIDGQLHQAQDSSLPGGTSPFPLLVRWRPTAPGNHTLIAQAINTQGGRAQAAVSVQAVQAAQGTDRDGDGVDDSVDACPDQSGAWADNGCPPAEEMSDPNEDLDGDGVLGAADACPDEAGPASAQGCPDVNGDGAPDDPGITAGDSGSSGEGGAPGGGEEPGGGAGPAPGGGGIPGGGDDEGVPVPGGDDDGASGIAPPGPMEAEFRLPVEFEALTFTVDQEYDYVHCYASLADGDAERFEFEPLGERQWDIAARLGGENSRTVLVQPEGPLVVRADCGGEVIYLSGPGSSEGTYYRLGTAINSHIPEEWDGRELTAQGEVAGHWFEARYRLCVGSCENAAFPAPILHLTDVGLTGHEPSMRYLTWQWTGDRSTISGFKLYVDGNFSRSPARERSSYQLQGGLLPACGERLEFQLTAYSGATLTPDRETPRSNVVVVETPPCRHYTVRVTFDEIETGSLQDGDPNSNWDAHRLGPIFGSFWAQGSNDESLSFDGSDGLHGLMLNSNTTQSVQSLFDWIWGELSILCGEPGCPPYYTPESSTVTIELGPDDDLTFGGVIYEWDRHGLAYIYYTPFNRSRTIPADEIRDVRPNVYYSLTDGPITLRVRLEVVSSYEVGGTKPDLTIVNVTNEESSGQLRIRVRNTNASMANQTVEVALADIARNQLIGTYTWENVTIAAGEERILQTDFPIEASGLRVIIDPDNRIDETNEGNNIYEAP
jgi:hypothetical protein